MGIFTSFRVRRLIARLSDSNAETRESAVMALGAIGEPAVPALTEALQSGDGLVRREVTCALAATGSAGVPVLLPLIEDEDVEVRAVAMRGLEIVGEAIAVPALSVALEDRAVSVRAAAAAALGVCGGADATAALFGALDDDVKGPEHREWDVKQAVAAALVECGEAEGSAVLIDALTNLTKEGAAVARALVRMGERGVPPLIGALEHQNPKVRERAARALGEIGSPSAAPALCRALGDDNGFVILAAQAAIRDMVEPVIPDLIAALGEKYGRARPSAIQLLSRIGRIPESEVTTFIEELGDEYESHRYLAAIALASMGDAALPAVPGLTMALRDESWRVRSAAAWALVGVGTPSRASVLAVGERLADDDKWVRCGVARALGSLGPAAAPALPCLVSALQDEMPEVRESAATALGNMGEAAAGAVPELIDSMGEDSAEGLHWGVVSAAAEALRKFRDRAKPALRQALTASGPGGRLGAASALDEEGVPVLVEALADEDGGVREWAGAALQRIGAPAVNALVGALQSPQEHQRRAAVHALGGIGEPAEPAVPALLEAVTAGSAARAAMVALGHIGSPAAVPGIVEALRGKDDSLRGVAGRALVKIGEPAIEPLVAALQAADPYVRQEAAKALGAIGDMRALHPLMRAVDDEEAIVIDEAARALGRLGNPAALPALIRALASDSAGARSTAASSLAEIGAGASVPALIQLLCDREYYVRRAAAEAIAKIRRTRGAPHAPQEFYATVMGHSARAEAGGESSRELVRQANFASACEDWDAAISYNRQLLELVGSNPPEVLVHNLAACLLGRGIRNGNRAIEILNQEGERWSTTRRRQLAEALDKVATDGSIIGGLLSSCHYDLDLFWGSLGELARAGGDVMASHKTCMSCGRRSRRLHRIEVSGGGCLVMCGECHRALEALQPALPEEAVSLLASAAEDIMEAAELDPRSERIQQGLQNINSTLSDLGLSLRKHGLR